MDRVTPLSSGFEVDDSTLSPGTIFRKNDGTLWKVLPNGDQEALGRGGSLPDPIVDPVNIATTDPLVTALSITSPPDPDEDNPNLIELISADALAVFRVTNAGKTTIRLVSSGEAFEVVDSAGHILLRANDAAFLVDNAAATKALLEIDRAIDSIGFFNQTPVAQPTGVAVTAAGIHAALVSLGLITA